MFMQLMRRVPKRPLFVTLWAAGVLLCGIGRAQAWELPSRPTHPDQCQPNQWIYTPDWRQWMNQRQQIALEISRRPSCDKMYKAGSGAWGNCMNQEMKIAGELYRRHDVIKDQATREYASAVAQCRGVAQQNQALIKQQEDNRRLAQQQQENNRRLAQQQQEAFERQRAQQADHERALAAARSEALRNQQRAELERANRQQAQQARNEPRVIASPTPSYYNNRNTPQIVQTPQQAAQSRIEAQQHQQLQQEQQAQATRDAFTQLGNLVGAMVNPPSPQQPVEPQMERASNMAAENDEARRRMLDIGLNPQGHQDAQLNSTISAVQETNSQLDRGGPVVTQTQNDAFAAIGSVFNSAVGQFAQAMNQLVTGGDANGVSAPPQQVSSSNNAATNQAPHETQRPQTAWSQFRNWASTTFNQQESREPGNPQDIAAAQNNGAVIAQQPISAIPIQVATGPDTPETTCGRLVLFAFNQCMFRECEKPLFKDHAQCKFFTTNPIAND